MTLFIISLSLVVFFFSGHPSSTHSGNPSPIPLHTQTNQPPQLHHAASPNLPDTQLTEPHRAAIADLFSAYQRAQSRSAKLDLLRQLFESPHSLIGSHHLIEHAIYNEDDPDLKRDLVVLLSRIYVPRPIGPSRPTEQQVDELDQILVAFTHSSELANYAIESNLLSAHSHLPELYQMVKPQLTKPQREALLRLHIHNAIVANMDPYLPMALTDEIKRTISPTEIDHIKRNIAISFDLLPIMDTAGNLSANPNRERALEEQFFLSSYQARGEPDHIAALRDGLSDSAESRSLIAAEFDKSDHRTQKEMLARMPGYMARQPYIEHALDNVLMEVALSDQTFSFDNQNDTLNIITLSAIYKRSGSARLKEKIRRRLLETDANSSNPSLKKSIHNIIGEDLNQ
ncbi:hypothetical protein KUW19_16300 [Ferrimonas balearica]|uniref:hypothetical protein n=1 Tax=Ferrimonas balearica TaxID=44012 RepID=UPI001C981241|nr:hypothetical protein [Ferrimonas balearica]MBY6108023.1 hypothetical protein [Ferrimonas balearica]